MTGKRKFDCSAHEVGESLRSRRSRRLPNRTNNLPAETLAKPTYFDDGDCEFICEYCSAFFWFAERITHGPLHSRPRYTHCCKGGAVRLPFPLCPPTAFKLLFEDSDFMDNDRAYNNMFSMTSFGTRIDDAVNDGRGPYVFKIFGQVSHWIGSICPPTNEGPWFLQLYIYDTINEVPSRLRFFESSDHRSLSPAVVTTLSKTLKCCNGFQQIVPPVLYYFTYQDNIVRYYTCEALYNIAKVVRGDFIVLFNDIFDCLCKFAADSDANVQSAAHLLDRLVKDIVTESDQFSIEEFMSAADLCDTCAECNYSVNYGDYYYSHHPIRIKRPTNNNNHPQMMMDPRHHALPLPGYHYGPQQHGLPPSGFFDRNAFCSMF